MIKRIITAAIAVVVFTAVGVGALAGEIKPYSMAALQKATAAGKTILLDFHADWCPVCRKQGPLLQSLVQEDKLKNVAAFKVNYDQEKELKQKFKVTSQSTLIVLKCETVVSRATGVTDKAAIRALIEKGL